MLRVVLIGPECTGKSTLGEQLAAHYGVPCSTEHARDYVEQIGRTLRYDDVEAIARGQQAAEDEVVARAAEAGAPLVLLDTDLISTMVYSRHYYEDCPTWVEAAGVSRLADLYLLHQVDVQWLQDGQQREQPERREELFVRFRLTLELLDARVVEIEGDWEQRKRRAIEAIDELLSGAPLR